MAWAYFIDREERLQQARATAAAATGGRAKPEDLRKALTQLQKDFPDGL